MKLGFGLYRHMLTPSNLAFVRQVGATHVIVHLVVRRQLDLLADDN